MLWNGKIKKLKFMKSYDANRKFRTMKNILKRWHNIYLVHSIVHRKKQALIRKYLYYWKRKNIKLSDPLHLSIAFTRAASLRNKLSSWRKSAKLTCLVKVNHEN